MEPWKIGAIVAVLISVLGFGMLQNNSTGGGGNGVPTPGPTTTPTPSPLLGKVPPPWAVTAPADWVNTKTPVTLPSVKGSVALVEIFRIQCKHCQEATPFMEMLYLHYKAQGLKMAALQSPGLVDDPQNPENDWKAVQKWIKEQGIKYPVGFDRKSAYFQGIFPTPKESKYYPTMFILDENGKIFYISNGFDAPKALRLIAALERILGNGSKERLVTIANKLVQLPEFAGAAPDTIVTEIESQMKWQDEQSKQIKK